MSYKQKSLRYNSRTQQDEEPYEELSRERKLVLAWQEECVNDSYQAIVLKHLDQLSGRELERQIEKELQRFYHKSSYYHKIQFLLREREKALDLLYECCSKLNKSIETDEILEYNLEQVCDLIDHIRKTSMYLSEIVWEMFEYFKFNTNNKHSLCEGKYYIDIFATFDKDWTFVKESLLRYYIPFLNNFDPLLLEAAKPLKKLYTQNKIVYNEHVDELFRINASYLYRLLRAHQRILCHYMLSKDLRALQERKQVQPQQYSYEKTISHYSSSSKQQKRSGPTSVKAKYNFYQRDSQGERYKQQLPKNNGQQKPPMRFSIEQRKSSNKDIRDNRKITRISQITISNNHQHSQQRYEEDQESCGPTKLVLTNPSQRERTTSGSRSGLVQCRHSETISRNEQLDHNMYLTRNLKTEGQNLQVAKPKKKEIRIVDTNQPLQRKRQKKLQFPRLSREQHHLHDQTQCLCRQKHKSRVRESHVDIPAEEIEQKRQTIIKAINHKYRQLAKKQIRYELSMMGDATYHRMKERALQSRLKREKSASKKQQKFQ